MSETSAGRPTEIFDWSVCEALGRTIFRPEKLIEKRNEPSAMQPLVGPGGSELLSAEIAILVGIWWCCWRAIRGLNDRVGNRN